MVSRRTCVASWIFRRDHPRRPKAMICCFFSSFKTFAMLREATYPPAVVNVLDVSSESMAAFQVFMYGRFWVFTEVDIAEKIKAYHGVRGPHDRDRSWEHCYRYFRSADASTIRKDHDQAALQLGFYLASWGMYRGSSFLLQPPGTKSGLRLLPFILRTTHTSSTKYLARWGYEEVLCQRF